MNFLQQPDLLGTLTERSPPGYASQNAVVAQRLHPIVLLGRETEELSAETPFGDSEVRVPHDFAREPGRPRLADLVE